MTVDEQISFLIAKEIAAAKGDKKRLGKLLHRLIYSAGMTVRRLADNDPKVIDRLAEMVAADLYEGMTFSAKVETFIHDLGKKKS